MISQLPLFRVFDAMARHAAEAQRVSATNISRAGEPGFKAVELESFESFVARASGGVGEGSLLVPFHTIDADTPAAPNGNTVSVEQEIFKSAEAMNQHELALSVYTKSVELLRTAIGKRG